jgi:hypothetical protein
MNGKHVHHGVTEDTEGTENGRNPMGWPSPFPWLSTSSVISVSSVSPW